MNHVTDERTDRTLGRDLHDWLDRSVDELPDGAELPSAIRSDVLSRLPGTPQRRRWWPFKRHPFGLGATRSAHAEEPKQEGRPKSMFTATRIAAAVAVLALAGSLTLLAGPLGSDPAPVPAATTSESPAAVDAFQVNGTAGIKLLEPGEESGDALRNRVGTNILMEMNDPRVSGEVRFLHHADDLGTVGVEWGTYRLENDDGAWQGPVSGFYSIDETRTSGWLTGEGAYEGLTYYMESVIDHGTMKGTINGIVYQGSQPTDYPELNTIE